MLIPHADLVEAILIWQFPGPMAGLCQAYAFMRPIFIDIKGRMLL